MRILSLGDLHLTNRQPRSRTDDYAKSQLAKMDEALHIAVAQKCRLIIFPGDVADSAREGHGLTEKYIRLLRKHLTVPDAPAVYAIYGQHDVFFHGSDLTKTPLGVLEAAGLLTVLRTGEVHTIRDLEGGNVSLYGASWGEEMPVPSPTSKTTLRVLVIHKMIVDQKLWAAQQDFSYGSHFLNAHPEFDLIVSGDNHKFFTASIGKGIHQRHLINCGSLMRTNSDQTEHQPSVMLFDTQTRKLERIVLKIAPAAVVFNLEKLHQAQALDHRLEEFAEQIIAAKSARSKAGLDFEDNLAQLSVHAPDGVKAALKSIMENAHVRNAN